MLSLTLKTSNWHEYLYKGKKYIFAKVTDKKKSRFRAQNERNIALDVILIQRDWYSERARSITPTLHHFPRIQGRIPPKDIEFQPSLNRCNVPLSSPIPQTHNETLSTRVWQIDNVVNSRRRTIYSIFNAFPQKCERQGCDRQGLPIGNGTHFKG